MSTSALIVLLCLAPLGLMRVVEALANYNSALVKGTFGTKGGLWLLACFFGSNAAAWAGSSASSEACVCVRMRLRSR